MQHNEMLIYLFLRFRKKVLGMKQTLLPQAGLLPLVPLALLPLVSSWGNSQSTLQILYSKDISMSYNINAMAAYQQYGQSMTASGGGRNMSGLGARSSTSSMTTAPSDPVDFTTIDTKTGKQTKVATITDYGNDDGPTVLYTKAANAATAAGVDLAKAAAKPFVDASLIYSEPRFNIEQQATKIEDYLRGTAIADSLYEAQGFEKPYSGLYIEEDRPMSEAELQKYKPLIDMADDVMNENITVEELGDMDREDQEAFLRAIGVQGLGPAKRDTVFVGGDFDVATTEEEFVRDLLNQGLTKRDASYWDKLSDFQRQKEEAEEDVVDATASVSSEAEDLALVPTRATTPTSEKETTEEFNERRRRERGLMSRPEGTGELAGRILDGKDGDLTESYASYVTPFDVTNNEIYEYAKEALPDSRLEAAALIATIEAESAGGKAQLESSNYTKEAALAMANQGKYKTQRKKEVEKIFKDANLTYVDKDGKTRMTPQGQVKFFNTVYDDKYRSEDYKLGNTEEGDGSRFRGRGLIQITGRDAYKEIGDRIGVDLIQNPHLLVTDKEVGLAAAKAFIEYKKEEQGIDSIDSSRDLYRIIGHSDDKKRTKQKARWKRAKEIERQIMRETSPRPKLRPTE
jgi:predicted chitinase